jgi:hypothetical protein
LPPSAVELRFENCSQPEERGSKLLQNLSNYLPTDIISYPRTLESSPILVIKLHCCAMKTLLNDSNTIMDVTYTLRLHDSLVLWLHVLYSSHTAGFYKGRS